MPGQGTRRCALAQNLDRKGRIQKAKTAAAVFLRDGETAKAKLHQGVPARLVKIGFGIGEGVALFRRKHIRQRAAKRVLNGDLFA